MQVDIARRKVIPDTYGLRLPSKGKNDPLRTPKTAMELALNKKVTLHLEGVNLDDFIMAVGASEGINIIADAIGNTATMTVHADDVPLIEILDYVSRNLGASFYVGDSIIWATKSEQPPQAGTPIETRMYSLRKGISSDELASDRINIVEAIERFIPQTTGSDLLFDKKAHVLLAKNTRENLTLIEDIIEKLDVCPPQVLIEARFIGTSVSDLRELGIDWVLKSPLIVTSKEVDGEWKSHSQVANEASANFVAFPNSAQGLNLTYQGLLTSPMFEAVLHALDISGKATTLSVPKVTTVNNRTAMIRIGEDFRYFDQFDVQSVPSSVTDSGSQVYSSILVPVGSPQLEELGIELSVIPSVGGDLQSINLNLTPEISEFVRYETYQVGSSSGNNNGNGNGGIVDRIASNRQDTAVLKIPIFRRSKIETEVVVQSGETVVMGGLISASESLQTHAVPFLSSIPLIGRLFTRQDTQEIKQNLLIFVTATILSERGEDLVPVFSTEIGKAENTADTP